MALLLVFIIMQFFRIDKTNPDFDASKDLLYMAKPEAKVTQLLKDACYDCHSYEVEYPWYTNIAPVSWWIKGHINHGQEHCNYSTWGLQTPEDANHNIEENIERLENKSMPLGSFKWNHPEARISDEERQILIEFFNELKVIR
ncbi:MAG: heme-binding domain-containing protein [Bacteroidota bacterium]